MQLTSGVFSSSRSNLSICPKYTNMQLVKQSASKRIFAPRSITHIYIEITPCTRLTPRHATAYFNFPAFNFARSAQIYAVSKRERQLDFTSQSSIIYKRYIVKIVRVYQSLENISFQILKVPTIIE